MDYGEAMSRRQPDGTRAVWDGGGEELTPVTLYVPEPLCAGKRDQNRPPTPLHLSRNDKEDKAKWYKISKIKQGNSTVCIAHLTISIG